MEFRDKAAERLTQGESLDALLEEAKRHAPF